MQHSKSINLYILNNLVEFGDKNNEGLPYIRFFLFGLTKLYA